MPPANAKLLRAVIFIALVALLAWESLVTTMILIDRRLVGPSNGPILTSSQLFEYYRLGNQEAVPPSDNPKPLLPVHVNSSWIGNQWIPPEGYRLYTAREMQSFFRNHSILWIGDSTARRTYGTLYQILNETSHPDDLTVDAIDRPQVIDMNRYERFAEPCNKPGYNLCRHIHNSGLYDHFMVRCMESLLDDLQNSTSLFWNDISNYTLVIIVMGPHEMLGRCRGPSKQWKNKTLEFARALVNVQPSHARIIWRTWGSIGSDNNTAAKQSLQQALQYNQVVKEAIDTHEASLKIIC